MFGLKVQNLIFAGNNGIGRMAALTCRTNLDGSDARRLTWHFKHRLHIQNLYIHDHRMSDGINSDLMWDLNRLALACRESADLDLIHAIACVFTKRPNVLQIAVKHM